jgi:hypothetical protein
MGTVGLNQEPKACPTPLLPPDFQSPRENRFWPQYPLEMEAKLMFMPATSYFVNLPGVRQKKVLLREPFRGA